MKEKTKKKPAAMKIKRGDRVVIITGKDKGGEGKVLMVDRKKERLVIEGKNMVTRHTKQSAQNQSGGLIKKESPLHVSNVMLIHNGKPTRVGFKVVRKEIDGKMVNVKYRVAKRTGDIID